MQQVYVQEILPIAPTMEETMLSDSHNQENEYICEDTEEETLDDEDSDSESDE